jgi:hypothetical protein
MSKFYIEIEQSQIKYLELINISLDASKMDLAPVKWKNI